MALSLVTPAATECLTISEVKQHLRLDTSNGEPAPTAPTVALVVIAGNLTAGVHRWLWVARTADGATEAGAVSAPLTTILATHGKATVTKPLGGSAVTYMDLYRTAAGGTTYLLVAATANDGATYTDNIADGSLGAQAPTTNTTADPELTSWLTAARQYCETFTHRALITQTWDLKLDGFPCGEAIWLPKPPLISITTATGLIVTYTATAGTLTTWAEANYTVDAPAGPTAAPGRIVPAYGVVYPSTRDVPNAVNVRFVAGYGAASAVPAGIKAAIKLLIGAWWNQREAVGAANLAETPMGVGALLWPFKSF